ncbi:MAG TPA: insulinase family protein, partial [Candidatus Paceibacterota bacterium]|nr:insulinase family protein [Candidatus Paceibacterota bacterium]
IAAITRDEFVAFHRENYRIGNVALLVVGDVSEKEVTEAARILTCGVPRGALITRPERLKEGPTPKTNEVIESSAKLFGLKGAARMKATKIRFQRILPWPWKETRAPDIGLRLVRELLMSRIRRELGVMYSPSWGLGDFIDHQHASMSVEILPSALKPALAIMRQIRNEIAAGERKHAKLFDEVKNAYIEQLRFRDDEVENIGYSACCEFNLRGRVIPIGEDVRYTEETSYRDVSDLFAREFTEEKLFWTILTP